MGTASAIPANRAEAGSRRLSVLFSRRNSFLFIKDRLLEERKHAEKNLPTRELAELNQRLWDAFISKNKEEMLRLVKAGANPHSIQNRLEREIVGCRY